MLGASLKRAGGSSGGSVGHELIQVGAGQTFIIFGVGLNVLAGSLLSPLGRKYIVFVTNIYCKSVGIRSVSLLPSLLKDPLLLVARLRESG